MEQPNGNDNDSIAEIDLVQENLPQHSDKEMLIQVGLKFLFLFIIILTFDFLVDLILMILDFILEIIHLLIELVEETLESILEEALPTTRHQNEVIIVNAAMIFVLFGIFKLFHGVRYLYHLKRHIKAAWLRYKKRKSMNWKVLPIMSKIILVTAYCTGFSLIFFLAF